jgi:hypothetical protein
MRTQERNVYRVLIRLGVVAFGFAAAAPAAAQMLRINFEPPNYQGCSEGVTVTGQQGWYRPDVMSSADEFIYTYDGNVLNLPANSYGGTQFLGGLVLGNSGELRRAQLNFDWSPTSVWAVSYDLAVRWNGALPAVDNIGSFSLQDSTMARYFISLNTWTNPDTATMWSAKYIRFFADGSMGDPAGELPAPEWANLAVNHWYREFTIFDFTSNTILYVAITDLDTGYALTATPTGWYLAGGASGNLPLPQALRFFIGGDGATTGNTMGWDNLQIDAIGGPVVQNPTESQHPQVTPQAARPATN